MWRTVDSQLVVMTSDFDSDATSSFCVINATQCRHILLTPLVHVETACYQHIPCRHNPCHGTKPTQWSKIFSILYWCKIQMSCYSNVSDRPHHRRRTVLHGVPNPPRGRQNFAGGQIWACPSMPAVGLQRGTDLLGDDAAFWQMTLTSLPYAAKVSDILLNSR